MRRKNLVLAGSILLLGASVAWFASGDGRTSWQPRGAAPEVVGVAVGRLPSATRTSSARTTAVREPTLQQQAIAERCARDYDIAMRAALAQLETTDDARTQLVRSLLLDDGLPSADANATEARSQGALARASALGSHDPLIAWFVARQCDASCAMEAAQHAVALDSDNAATWIMLMDTALRAGNETRAQRALAGAARATHYDDHFGETAEEVAAVMQVVNWPQTCERNAAAVGLAWGLDRPATQWDAVATRAIAESVGGILVGGGFFKTCGPRHPPWKGTMQTECSRTLALMAGADTLLPRLLGLSGLVAATANTGEGPHWREELRRLYWLQHQQTRYPTLLLGADNWRFGEIPAVQAHLQRRGLWPPPPEWLPENARAKALVLTGLPPPDH